MALLTKRDCETHEIQLKFCKAHIFLKTIRHPLTLVCILQELWTTSSNHAFLNLNIYLFCYWKSIYYEKRRLKYKPYQISAYFCCGLNSTLTMSSLLPGIPFKTSAFRRRSMWGPRISCSFLIWSSLATSSNSVRKLFWLLKRIQSKYKIFTTGTRKKHNFTIQVCELIRVSWLGFANKELWSTWTLLDPRN